MNPKQKYSIGRKLNTVEFIRPIRTWMKRVDGDACALQPVGQLLGVQHVGQFRLSVSRIFAVVLLPVQVVPVHLASFVGQAWYNHDPRGIASTFSLRPWVPLICFGNYRTRELIASFSLILITIFFQKTRLAYCYRKKDNIFDKTDYRFMSLSLLKDTHWEHDSGLLQLGV